MILKSCSGRVVKVRDGLVEVEFVTLENELRYTFKELKKSKFR